MKKIPLLWAGRKSEPDEIVELRGKEPLSLVADVGIDVAGGFNIGVP